jgi:hypothetical protein
MELQEYTLNDPVTPFQSYAQGHDLFMNADIRTELLEEKIRYFFEECDSPQGFRILTDASTGFSGFSGALLEALDEDYSKKVKITLGITTSEGPYARINEANALHTLSSYSSVYLPLHFPDFESHDTKPWAYFLNSHVKHIRF